jgi:hypothetical protein
MIDHAWIVFYKVLTPIGISSILCRSSYNLLRFPFKLASLIFPLIHLNVLQFRVVYLNFSKIPIILRLLSSTWLVGTSLNFDLVSFLLGRFLANNFFHMLNFRLFILIIDMIIIRASWMMMINYKLVTFAIYFCYHLIRLCNCWLGTILRAYSTTRSGTSIWRWCLWNITNLQFILNIGHF